MGAKGTCKAAGCEQDVRGKGYCERHYRAWKRGKMPKPRFTRCNAEGCTKPATIRHLCETHHASATRRTPKEATGGESGAETATVAET
jgi:hypothetical protein